MVGLHALLRDLYGKLNKFKEYCTKLCIWIKETAKLVRFRFRKQMLTSENKTLDKTELVARKAG